MQSLRVWIGAVFCLAVISLIVDQTTGDTTGPPYHDSLLNQAAFFVFFAAVIVFLGLCLFGLIRWVRGGLPHHR
ncbi:MAG: hypothetical protein M3P18_18760 [Actinomycetota bacterium]|nr:hypothetical protein [Actinomycetota bacterium]